MKFAVETATYFTDAIVDLLSHNGYDGDILYMGHDNPKYILVNTTKKTIKSGPDANGRTVYSPTSQWAAIAALVNATDGGAQAAAPVATSFRVGDVVTVMNTETTKDKFHLSTSYRYTVAAITPSGKLNLGGEHDYLPSRFTRATIPVATPVAAPVALPTPAAIIPVDFACNPLAVGDTVLVISPASRKPQFVLRTNGVAVITRITAKGALGFAFDEDNEFLSKRFQKVTVSSALNTDQFYNGECAVQSGDLVVARPGRHQSNADNASKFALPTDTALVFRGVTVDKGNFILDGYTDHAYSPARFSVVTPVGA